MNESSQLQAVTHNDDGLDLRELIRVLWAGKWVVAGISTFVAVLAIAYALLATEWYESEVLLVPTDDKTAQGLASQLGGLASLAGVNIGSEGTAEPLAVLRSREFARDFIVDLDLMPVFFADEWDAENKRWIDDSTDERPDIRDAVKFFREDLLNVSEDSQTGLVSLRLEWTDPETAAEWASLLVARLNDRMRQQALREAERNVDFLQVELNDVSVFAIQQSIGRLLESEMQKLMLARGNKEFSFRVVDPASTPKYRSRPRRTLLVITSTVFGGMIGVFAVLLLRVLRRQD